VADPAELPKSEFKWRTARVARISRGSEPTKRRAPFRVTRAVLGGIALVLSACSRPAADPMGARNRFSAYDDATVRDNATGLVWARDANLPGFRDMWDGATWAEALEFVSAMNAGSRPNMGHTDWRLPQAAELRDFLQAFWRPEPVMDELWFALTGIPPLRADERAGFRRARPDMFINVAETAYWSGNNICACAKGPELGPYAPNARDANAYDDAVSALAIDTGGAALVLDKSERKRVWPVCGGPGGPESPPHRDQGAGADQGASPATTAPLFRSTIQAVHSPLPAN
jgi:Protein of unknown function (DUF1566)